ncbi:MAG: hypothetical protein ACRDZZ_09585 [Ilumatobacteraceae bacterium]
MTPTAILRVIGAAAALVSGYAHLTLYNDGYDEIPSEFGGVAGLDLGQQFLINALGALAIALGLVVPLFVEAVPDFVWKLAALGGVVWAALSLVAFYLAHETDGGWFDYRDQPGLKPSPEAALSVFSEAVVLVVAIVLLALTARRGPSEAA